MSNQVLRSSRNAQLSLYLSTLWYGIICRFWERRPEPYRRHPSGVKRPIDSEAEHDQVTVVTMGDSVFGVTSLPNQQNSTSDNISHGFIIVFRVPKTSRSII